MQQSRLTAEHSTPMTGQVLLFDAYFVTSDWFSIIEGLVGLALVAISRSTFIQQDRHAVTNTNCEDVNIQVQIVKNVFMITCHAF